MSSSTASLSVPPKLLIDVIVMEKLIEDLERGKEAAHMMRSMILEHYPRVKIENIYENDNISQDNNKALLEHHSMVALDTYATTLSMLKCCDSKGVLVGKRKLHQVKHDPDSSVHNHGRRDCYKRRKNKGSKEEEITQYLTDDGFSWRKYGQKKIHQHHHPRNYYRCTYKHEQKCEATKQVQQISDNPAKYKIIYHGNHCCNNTSTPQSAIESPEEQLPAGTIVLSFDQSNNVNPLLFPTSAYPAVITTSSVTQNTSSPSCNGPSVSGDQAGTMSPVGASINAAFGEQNDEVLEAEKCSSSVSYDDLEEDYSFIMADCSELLHDLWNW